MPAMNMAATALVVWMIKRRGSLAGTVRKPARRVRRPNVLGERPRRSTACAPTERANRGSSGRAGRANGRSSEFIANGLHDEIEPGQFLIGRPPKRSRCTRRRLAALDAAVEFGAGGFPAADRVLQPTKDVD
jgi:hypothetical protein